MSFQNEKIDFIAVVCGYGYLSFVEAYAYSDVQNLPLYYVSNVSDNVNTSMEAEGKRPWAA